MKIHAVRDLAARHAHHAVEAVGFFRALRHGHFRREALRRIAAGDDHRRSGDEHARAGNDAFVDRLPQSDVRISGAFGAEVANGGDAGHQRRARVIHGARDAQRQRLAQHLIVPDGLVVGMQQQMRVPLDHARASASCPSATIVRAPAEPSSTRPGPQRRCARRARPRSIPCASTRRRTRDRVAGRRSREPAAVRTSRPAGLSSANTTSRIFMAIERFLRRLSIGGLESRGVDAADLSPVPEAQRTQSPSISS